MMRQSVSRRFIRELAGTFGVWAVGLAFISATSAVAAGEEPTEPAQSSTVNAPVAYENLMLVVTTDEGVAAFDFLEPIENRAGDRIEYGIAYRFRYLAKDATIEESGSGRVFELYLKTDDGEKYSSGGDCVLDAGAIKLSWSRGGPKAGWIYYQPDKVRVQIANDSFFQSRMVGDRLTERLDLRRYR